MARPELRRVTAGRYAYRGRYIIRTVWDGPRGGKVFWWELGDHDEYEAVVLDGLSAYRTLGAAMSAIDAESRDD